MFNINYLVRLVLKANAIKTLNNILLISLFFIANTTLSFYFVKKLGIPSTILIIMLSNLLLFKILKKTIITIDEEIKNSIKKGVYPEQEMCELCSLYVMVPMLLSPGLLTFFMVILLAYVFRYPFGKYMSDRLKIDNIDLYEYLKLQDFTLNEELNLKKHLKEEKKISSF